MGTIVIVSADEPLGSALRAEFERRGHSVLVATDEISGLGAVSIANPSAIILDSDLSRPTPADVSERVHQSGRPVPLVVLGRNGGEPARESHAMSTHHYYAKPLRLVEFVDRVESELGPPGLPPPLATATFGDIAVDFRRQIATRAGAPLELTPREFKILRFLIERKGEVVTRKQLLAAVWNYRDMRMTRTVDVHIAKLRKKIEESPADPRFIVTVHRVGYRFRG